MNLTMVIPTYWGREKKVGFKKGDAIYDHPTPLDEEGSLKRAIESIEVLKDKEFELVVIVVATSSEIEGEAEEKVKAIIGSLSLRDVRIRLFGPTKLKEMQDLLIKSGGEGYIDLLKLSGYANVRNMCLFVPHILKSDAIVFIDDDEVFEDPDFIAKAKEFIGKDHYGKPVYAVAGYYLQPDGGYLIKKPFRPWMRYWDQYKMMNMAFERFISGGPRLKITPFVFGGNMVIHRNLFKKVPFDPGITRGEDIDFLINAKMFGFDFFLDNRLTIKHLPPPKPHSVWRQLREDIFRFVFERDKILKQQEMIGMRKVSPEDFDPYPGCFLKDDLFEKISRSQELLSIEYLTEGDRESSKEALRNIVIAETEAKPKEDTFLNLINLQKRWQTLMEFVEKEEVRERLRGIIEKR